MFSSSNTNSSQQAQSGVSDLFLGAGGFSGALGNGFSNDTNTSSTSNNPVGTNNGANTLDLSDFPILGGSGGGGGGASSGSSGNGLAAALRQQQQQQQQQQLLAHQQMLQSGGGSKQQNNLYRQAMAAGTNGSNFTMATEDFPALPGAPPSGTGNVTASAPSSLLMGGSNNGVNSSQTGVNLGVAGSSRPQSTGSGDLHSSDATDRNSNNHTDASGLVGGAGGLGGGLVSLGGLQQPTSTASSSNQQSLLASSRGSNATGSAPIPSTGGGSGPAIGSALSGDYGLLGLLGIIRMTDADRNALALGSDPTMLGLNLGTADQIYRTFSSPWSETPSTKEPHFQLPSCYFMQPPALKTGHLSKFQLETLFYIFYAFPKDVLQAYAAQELYTREWRYHADLKLWFKRAGPSDGIASTTGGAPQYLYFDINSWERRGFNGNMNQNFTSGFLSEDDVRVKFPSS